MIKLQYHNEKNIVSLFEWYWHDTTNREIKVDHYHGLVKTNTKNKFCNIEYVFVFAKQCQQVYYTYNHSLIKDCSRFNWLSIAKIKPWGHVQVVENGIDEVTAWDDVFQLDELVNPYQVVLSTDLEKKHILRISEQLKINKDDNIV